MLEISGLSHQKYSVFFYHECLNVLLNTSAGFTLTNPEVQNSGLTWQLPRHQLWDLNFISLWIGCKSSKHHPVLLPQTRLEVFLIQLVTYSVNIWCSAANYPIVSSNMSCFVATNQAGKRPNIVLKISGLRPQTSHQKYSGFFPLTGLKTVSRLIKKYLFFSWLNISAGFSLTHLEVPSIGLTWQLSSHQLWDF